MLYNTYIAVVQDAQDPVSVYAMVNRSATALIMCVHAGLLSFYRTQQSGLMFVCFLLTSKLRQCDLVQVYKRAVPSKMDHFCVPHQSNTIATRTNHEIHTSFCFVNL